VETRPTANAAAPAAAPPSTPWRLPAGAWGLLGLGLLGHLYAAHAVGGSRTAYIHHVLGFVVILLVTGSVLGGVAWRYWRARPTPMLLAISALQALAGLWVAAAPLTVTVGR
jgi:hypothetical protein